MNVIGHQAPSEQASLGVDQVIAEQAQVGVAIEFNLKDRTAVHAALSDVVGHTVDDAALSSWHNLCVW